MAQRIVIIGGGFGGVKCAARLRRRLPRDRFEIVLFNSENSMVFSPLLAEVAGATINREAVVAPLRTMLPGVICRNEDIQRVEFETNRIEYLSLEGDMRWLAYDHIVLATGSDVNLAVIPGMADHSFPLRTVSNAMALRFQIVRQLEKAEVTENPVRRARYLSFIVVGGGFSGVEVAGEINDFLKECLPYFPGLMNAEAKVTLIHSRDEILPEISPPLRSFARRKMEAAGIRMILNARAAAVTRRGVSLASGEMVGGGTVVCTIGNTASPLIEKMKWSKEKGRLLTESDMRLQGLKNAWAVGDCAHIVNAHDGSVSPPTGQFAERQGRQAADNIANAIAGRPTRPFRFRPLGQLCSIGGRRGVADILGVRISGGLAWFIWRGVYLFKLPSWGRRIRVGFDWAWDAFFPRDLSHPRADALNQISKAFYQTGDVIFRPGDPALQFYVIEKGRVEIFKQDPGARTTTPVAVLSTGDFFGEMALIDRRPHHMGARTLGPTKLLVLGGNVFSSFSEVMLPLKNLIMAAVRRRKPDFWKRLPNMADTLSRLTVGDVIAGTTAETIRTTETVERAFRMLEGQCTHALTVVDADGVLTGIVTWSDIFRGVETGATFASPIASVMATSPHYVTRNDSCLVAATTMREHGFKGIPVVEDRVSMRLAGYLRAPTLLERFLKPEGMVRSQ